MAYIQGIDRNQHIMLPEYLEDYITEDNVIRFIDKYINTLDLENMGFKVRKHGSGAPG